jgi:hypothetical protein
LLIGGVYTIRAFVPTALSLNATRGPPTMPSSSTASNAVELSVIV